MTQSTHLALPYIDAAQAQKHVTHNEALQLLDALAHLSVSERDQTAPPASPTEGQRFLVGAGASGAFAGKDFQIATFLAGAWVFLCPRAGWRVYVEAETLLLVYDGASWKDVWAEPARAAKSDLARRRRDSGRDQSAIRQAQQRAVHGEDRRRGRRRAICASSSTRRARPRRSPICSRPASPAAPRSA